MKLTCWRTSKLSTRRTPHAPYQPEAPESSRRTRQTSGGFPAILKSFMSAAGDAVSKADSLDKAVGKLPPPPVGRKSGRARYSRSLQQALVVVLRKILRRLSRASLLVARW